MRHYWAASLLTASLSSVCPRGSPAQPRRLFSPARSSISWFAHWLILFVSSPSAVFIFLASVSLQECNLWSVENVPVWASPLCNQGYRHVHRHPWYGCLSSMLAFRHLFVRMADFVADPSGDSNHSDTRTRHASQSGLSLIACELNFSAWQTTESNTGQATISFMPWKVFSLWFVITSPAHNEVQPSGKPALLQSNIHVFFPSAGAVHFPQCYQTTKLRLYFKVKRSFKM